MSYKGKKKSKLYDSAEGYDLYADQYDEDLNYLRTFEKDIFFSLLGDIKGKRILDLGCGTGRLIGELKLLGAEVVACDISPEMVKITKKKFPNIEVVLGDAMELTFKNEEFDMVIATFLLVHLEYPEAAFEEVYRVLADDGVFVLTNINQRKAPKLEIKSGEEIVIKSKYHRPKDVIQTLENNFFKIEREEFIYNGGTWINQIIKARK